MSEHLAVAVEKASLFRQSEMRSRQLSVLNTIGAAVSRSLNLEMVLNEAIEKMIEKLNFDAAWIYILRPVLERHSVSRHTGALPKTSRGLLLNEVYQPESLLRFSRRASDWFLRTFKMTQHTGISVIDIR